MEPDDAQVLYSTLQHSNSFKRPRRSLQSSTPLGAVSESASSSPRVSGQMQFNPEVIEHINALKHLNDKQILQLLEVARNGDHMRVSGPDRSSMSTLGSRSSSYLSVPSSRVTSILSDPRSSIASTDSSFTNYSAASRLSTASSRLSTISTTSAPKNFACTFCDKGLKSKPYWKSHEEEFHEQRLTWRCPDCEQIFHAGKRFREHHTKLHGCENCKQPRETGQPTSRKASPCVKKYEIVMHDKDAWGCGFCAALLNTWEERCEHIALHFEEKRSGWKFTNVILGLLKQPNVSQSWNLLLTQRHGDQQNWPQFTWESKKCNRLRYKLETKWDIRAFDIEALVSETYELAEIQAVEVKENMEPTEISDVVETTVEPKMEQFDFTSAHRLSSSQEQPVENSMMELDPIEPIQSVPQPDPQQNQWPVTTDMASGSMNTDVTMDAFNGFTANINNISTEFTQQNVAQSYQQPPWQDASFQAPPNLLDFQQHANYMSYAPAKEVIQVPTSQFANFVRPASQHSSHQMQASFARPTSQHASQHARPNFMQYPRQSVPPNFLHHSSTSARRVAPKVVNIPSSNRSDQPPPPPPKDNHIFNALSMRRRPSNISQHTVVSQRDLGWHDEQIWG